MRRNYAEYPPCRGKSENDSRFMLSSVHRKVRRAEYFRNDGRVVECEGDEDIDGKRPPFGADAQSPHDGGKTEIDEVKIKNKGHAPVVGEPYFTKMG